jgi:Putative Actinobacterial Holin-X, holin superfamily III
MITRTGSSIMGLVREFKQEAKVFLREEIQLVKAEIAEKLGRYGRNSTSIAIGGFLAYAGVIVFLAALGAVLAYWFRTLGLDPLLAGFIGLGIIGVLAIATGAIMLLAGIKALKQVSPAPQRTVRTLQQFRGPEPAPSTEPLKPKKDERTPEQVEASVVMAEAQMADTLEQLADRVSLSRARRRVSAEVQTHPYRWGLVAAGCGAASSYLLRRKRAK